MKTTPKRPVAAVYDRRIFLDNQQIPSCVFPCPPKPWRRWMRLIICFCLGLIGFSASAQVQQAWVARYNNGILNGTNQAVKMALDPAGNIYITGSSQNTNGNLDYATIKYSPSGAQTWAARFDSTNSPSAIPVGLALDPSNNVFVTGSAITVKYNANGNQMWTAPYAGAAVATDTNGNICVVGYSTDFGTAKLSPAGSNLWTASAPSATGPALSQKLAIDGSGNIYVAGSTTGFCETNSCYVGLQLVKYDGNGNQLWTVEQGLGDGVATEVVGWSLDSSANAYVLANAPNMPCNSFKFSSNGSKVWTEVNPTGDAFSYAYGLALDNSENAVVMVKNSYYYPNSSYGTYKINPAGVYVWTNLYPQAPTSVNVGTAIAVDQANNVYVTGFSPGTNSGNDIVTIKYDNNGNQLWVQRYNGPGNGDDEGNAIAVDVLGNVYVTGYETTAGGGTEMVTIKYAPSPSGNKQTNGAFLLQTQGEPGEAFDIQATTNFTNWLDLGTINADTNGNLQFLDTNAPSFNRRFYITKPQ